MKLIMMAAALTLGTAAVAQTTEEETDATTTETTTTTTTSTTQPAPGNMSTMRTGGQTVAPGNGSPETDARGIPVISAPAAAPAGYNQPAQQIPAGSPVPTVARPTPTAAGALPPCTRTVTDRCTQTYERGRAR
jgi:ABC-type Fe3+-hydroxamate transport system substrate-binding protein